MSHSLLVDVMSSYTTVTCHLHLRHVRFHTNRLDHMCGVQPFTFIACAHSVHDITPCRLVEKPPICQFFLHMALWGNRFTCTYVFAHQQHVTIVISCIIATIFKGQLHKVTLCSRTFYLTAFCARDSSPHLPFTLAQLMKPSIGQNMSCTVDNFAQHLGPFFFFFFFFKRYGSLIVHACVCDHVPCPCFVFSRHLGSLVFCMYKVT